MPAPARRGALRFSWLAVTCLLLVIVAGCITTAATYTVLYVASTMQHTATVEVQAKPADVYAAMLRVVQRRSDVLITKQDDARYLLEVSKGKNKATAQVGTAAGGMAQLKVTAQEGEQEASHEDLAYRIVTQVCNELGVQYRVVEKKGLF